MPQSRANSAGKFAKRVARKAARSVLPVVQRAAGVKNQAPSGPPRSAKRPKPTQTAATGEQLGQLAKALGAPGVADVERLIQTASRRLAEGRVLRTLATGGTREDAWAAAARELIATHQAQRALSIGHALRRDPATEPVGRLVAGIAITSSSRPHEAWEAFAPLRGTVTATAAAREYYRVHLSVDSRTALADLREAIGNGEVGRWSPQDLISVAQNAASVDGNDVAEALLDEIDRRRPETVTNKIREAADKARTWLPGGRRVGVVETHPGTINFGVLSYFQPDFVSRNIGDSIQTIASLGHLVRHRGFKYTGHEGIVEFIDEARGRLKPERAVDSPDATFNMIDLYRDANVYQQLPEKTWALMFGWYMHSTYIKGFNIPFHPNLLPIPVSMFFRYAESITPEAADYLRNFGPIGCRDWQSVALLTAAGVPAFFSGCITTTIDTLFAPAGPDHRGGRLFVDSPKTGEGDSRVQVQASMRHKSVLENLRVGRRWVTSYADKYREVVTSRLHCYLPARSVGADVTFLPKNPSDNRFGGLYGIDDAAYEEIRQGILTKLDSTLSLIASGAEPSAVYEHWRKITQADVEASVAHVRTAGLLSDLGKDLEDPAALEPAPSDALRVVVDAVEGELQGIPGLIDTATAATTAPIDWVIATSETPSARLTEAAEAAAEGRITWYSSSGPAEAALLEALEAAGGDRVIVLAAASRVDADLSDLAATKASGDVAAAVSDRRRSHASGHQMLRQLSSAQKDDVETALDLVYRAANSYPWDATPFASGVMVLDVDTLAAEGSLAAARDLVVTKHSSVETALNAVVAGRRTELEEHWHFQPRQQILDDPKITVWRPGAKPWDKASYVPGQD